MRTTMKMSFVLMVASLLGTIGCQQTSQQHRPYAGYPPTELPSAEVVREHCNEPTRGLVSLAKHMPKEVIVGQTFEYQLELRSSECVDNLVVTDRIPAGAAYVKSEPVAEVNGDLMIWHLPPMDGRHSATVRVWLKAEREGTLSACATIRADPRVCAETFVGKPALTLEKSGPETAILGDTIHYTMVVANKGSTVARNVVVVDTVPDGLENADGKKEMTYEVGDLAPNQSKTITVALKAVARGQHCNAAVATAGDAETVKAQACTTVLQHGLDIEKTGTKEQFLGRNATYTILVSNTGDTTLTGVVVTDVIPAETRVVDSGGGTVSGDTITWNLGEFAKGGSRSYQITVTSMTPGNHCDNASVTCTEGLKAASEACTVWKGVSALLLEKGDHPDPIQVGEQTTYYVRVTNQGTAPDADIKVVVEFPKEITPLSADNGGQVEGQRVTFPAYPTLDPKQMFEYHVIAKGAVPGDARVKFIRTSRDIPAPTTAEESTRVY